MITLRLTDLSRPGPGQRDRTGNRTLTTAVIFIPSDAEHFDQYLSQCLACRESCGYKDGGVVRDLHNAVTMQAGGLATVIIVARRDHLPPDGGPRIEVAAEKTPSRAVDGRRNAARLRRPHRL